MSRKHDVFCQGAHIVVLILFSFLLLLFFLQFLCSVSRHSVESNREFCRHRCASHTRNAILLSSSTRQNKRCQSDERERESEKMWDAIHMNAVVKAHIGASTMASNVKMCIVCSLYQWNRSVSCEPQRNVVFSNRVRTIHYQRSCKHASSQQCLSSSRVCCVDMHRVDTEKVKKQQTSIWNYMYRRTQ